MISGSPDLKTAPLVEPRTGTRCPSTSAAGRPTAAETTRVSTSGLPGCSGSAGTSTMACSASVNAQARSAISCIGRRCGSVRDSSAVVISRLASIHFTDIRSRSKTCALSMATAAAKARARAAISSASENTRASSTWVRYRLPNTAPRMVIGTARKARIAGWCSGNPAAAGWAVRSSIRSAGVSSRDRLSSPLPTGWCPMRRTVSASMPSCTKEIRLACRSRTARAPYGADVNSLAALMIRCSVASRSRPAPISAITRSSFSV